MAKKLKKAFTITELVIVIAVIAILAAVLIPTFSNIIRRANQSADTQNIKSMNETLNAAELLDEKPTTMSEVISIVAESGYLIENLSPTGSGYDIVWDEAHNRLALISDTGEIIYSDGDVSQNAWKLWKIVSEIPSDASEEGYSYYLASGYTGDEIAVSAGFDAGENINLDVTITTEEGKDVTVNTNGGTLTVDAPAATVNHYGRLSQVNINHIASESYHEFGTVIGELAVTNGHVVLESGSNVMFVQINGTTEEEIRNVTINISSSASYRYVTAERSELLSAAVDQVTTGNQEPVKTLEKLTDGTVAFMIAGEAVTEYTNIDVALSAFKNTEGAKLELLADIVNRSPARADAVEINMPANGELEGNGFMLYGNVCVRVNKAGGTIRNVVFSYIHNNTEATQEDCDWYGWASKEGTLTPVYASGLEGDLLIQGCTFDNADWDSIQATPVTGASITIVDNVFSHSDENLLSQLRYIHIQPSSEVFAYIDVTITDNKFYATKDENADEICAIGAWFICLGQENAFDFSNNMIEGGMEMVAIWIASAEGVDISNKISPFGWTTKPVSGYGGIFEQLIWNN